MRGGALAGVGFLIFDFFLFHHGHHGSFGGRTRCHRFFWCSMPLIHRKSLTRRIAVANVIAATRYLVFARGCGVWLLARGAERLLFGRACLTPVKHCCGFAWESLTTLLPTSTIHKQNYGLTWLATLRPTPRTLRFDLVHYQLPPKLQPRLKAAHKMSLQESLHWLDVLKALLRRDLAQR